MNLLSLIATAFCINLIVGCLVSCYIVLKSNHETFYDRQVGLLFMTCIMWWNWKEYAEEIEKL